MFETGEGWDRCGTKQVNATNTHTQKRIEGKKKDTRLGQMNVTCPAFLRGVTGVSRGVND